MSLESEIEALYLRWHNHQQASLQISRNVWYIGYFVGFGDVFPRYRIFRVPNALRTPTFKSQEFQERELDAALRSEKLQGSVLFSTTPTYYSQFQSACLLRSRGFQLLEGKCYLHPAYTEKSSYTVEHPGVPDKRLHWEHVWWKVQGSPPAEIGRPSEKDLMNNCGVDSLWGLDDVRNHDSGCRKEHLTIAWMPRGTPFPPGWKRFYSAQDYKLGVNFDRVQEEGSKVQVCPHKFDLKIFDGWEPDFKKWSPW